MEEKLESKSKTVKELAEEAWEDCDACTSQDKNMWTNGWQYGYNRAKPSIEDLHKIWEAGKEYLLTSGTSVTFEELIERLKL